MKRTFREAPLCIIPDWRNAWRYLSVQAAAALGLLAAAYDYLPELRLYFPDGVVKYAALAIIIARIIQQNGQPRPLA